MALRDDLLAQLAVLNAELDARSFSSRNLDLYYVGSCPLPDAIVRARVTRAYRSLMGLAEAPWGSLIVDSVQDRLEVIGIRDQDDQIADAVWGIWQDNQMDAESKLAHNSALVTGRSYALVWPDASGRPEISLDNDEQMVVMYREGSRRERVAALRRWVDGDTRYATLYRPDGIYKFQMPAPRVPDVLDSPASARQEWVRRDVPDEAWPLPNPLGVVPVVELAVNRRLRPGVFPYSRGEYAHCTGLIDRINTLTFLGLVVAFWMGFPLRVLIGEKILRDDDNKPLPPFEAMADSVVQFENPEAKLDEYKAADRKNLSIYPELDQLATITKTPRHYMPMESGMANLSADAIRASEGGLVAKVPSHKASLGEGWEEVLRLAGLMLEQPVELSPRAELVWKDHEFRSLSERADAATKLKDLFPWQAIAEKVLDATGDEINRWAAMRASDGFGQLLASATSSPTAAIPGLVVSNGNGNVPG